MLTIEQKRELKESISILIDHSLFNLRNIDHLLAGFDGQPLTMEQITRAVRSVERLEKVLARQIAPEVPGFRVDDPIEQLGE